MKSLRYLNCVLTLIAVLLTLSLYTQWTGAGAAHLPLDGAGSAHAAGEEGLANPANQRNEMIAQLKKQVAATENLLTLIKSGTVKVKVDSDVKK